jgi:hypothetical protein
MISGKAKQSGSCSTATQPVMFCMYKVIGKGKGKAIHVQAWRVPEGFRKLRLPDFKIIDI